MDDDIKHTPSAKDDPIAYQKAYRAKNKVRLDRLARLREREKGFIERLTEVGKPQISRTFVDAVRELFEHLDIEPREFITAKTCFTAISEHCFRLNNLHETNITLEKEILQLYASVRRAVQENRRALEKLENVNKTIFINHVDNS